MPYKCTSCDKRFRYKVSQRTHKCKAQPPGAVVRQFGDLVQRLLLQQTQNGHILHENKNETIENLEISPVNNLTHRLIIQTSTNPSLTSNNEMALAETDQTLTNIDDTNNFVQQLLMQQTHSEHTNNNIVNETIHTTLDNIQVPSSNEHCSTVNEECLKRLLYDTGDIT